MPSIFLFLFPVLELVVESLISLLLGLVDLLLSLSHESLFWLESDLLKILKPADDVFGIDVFQALFNEATHITFKCVIFL